MTKIILVNWNTNKIELKMRKVYRKDKYMIEAKLKEKKLKRMKSERGLN